RRAAAVVLAILGIAGSSPIAWAAPSVNAGRNVPSTTTPFTATTVARFDTPWAIAFLPDSRMLVTEKPGRLFLVTREGSKTE
ncbi:PQQ-dependent sugar dehydrogenase, partial [Mycobacterium tuberculosis]|nr:PQQ-dependent sugar dehydrogenase [Mycobacterium tuberculosis]